MNEIALSIAGQPWLKAPGTRAVMAALDGEGGAARFVGGCVRNAVLGRPVEDIDIATTHLPDKVIALLEQAKLKAVPTGLTHGTVTAVAKGEPFEVTTLRRDMRTDGRHAEVAFTDEWDADARRRDFTMNALYADAGGRVFDPLGTGVEDARAGRVRFIGDADARIQEDFLRVLRFFRFHAWYGRGAPDGVGVAACARHVEGLAQLSGERIQAELLKLLAAPDPRPAVMAMATAGIFAAALPEAGERDLFERLIRVQTDNMLPADAELRLAALLPSADAVAELAARLKLANALRARLKAVLSDTSKIVSYLAPKEMRRLVFRLGQRVFADRLMLEWAKDKKRANAVAWRALLAMAESWQPPAFPLTGEDVMAAGVPKGPAIGRVLTEVEAWWIDADFPDDRLALIERMKSVVQAGVL